MSILIGWLATSIAIWATAQFLPGFQVKNGFKGAILVALVLGLLSVLFGWLLWGVIGIGTLGLAFVLKPLTRWLITAILLVATDKLSDTLAIRSFGLAFGSAIIITLGSDLIERLLFAVL